MYKNRALPTGKEMSFVARQDDNCSSVLHALDSTGNHTRVCFEGRNLIDTYTVCRCVTYGDASPQCHYGKSKDTQLPLGHLPRSR